MVPRKWRTALAHYYLAEILTAVLAVGSSVFAGTLILNPGPLEATVSFHTTFQIAPPQAWGVSLLVTSVASLALLAHSRKLAAIPVFMLGIIWTGWTITIILSPGFTPTSPTIYAITSTFNLVIGVALSVEREKHRDK